jgi:uncharacterized NAD(P)/FAD-binding protein YdhS
VTPSSDVLIIGLGPCGLTVLERVLALAAQDRWRMPGRRLRVAVVDPHGSGHGVHPPSQPDYLLLNAPCSQVSMFPDRGSVPPETVRPGPSLYEWARARDLRVDGDGYTVGRRGRPVHPDDHLPRRLLGEYLNWFRQRLLHEVPDSVEVTMHTTSAVDMSGVDGARVVRCADGSEVLAHQVFLSTGYTPDTAGPDREPGRERLVAVPYPLPSRTAAIGAGDVVGVAGFGLSAMDVVAALTVGRGGRFVGRDDRLRYRRSGEEPALLMWSRSGVPPRARPRARRDGPPPRPVFHTTAAVDALRRRRPGGRLDFRADLLPLILTEMRLAYRRNEARRRGDAELLAAIDELARAPEPTALAAALDAWDARLGRFDALAALTNAAGMVCRDSEGYERWLVAMVQGDLAEGARALSDSPLKDAVEVVEDQRDTIRYAVDFGGLTGRSQAQFMSAFAPLFNRAVVGPQWERHAELVALMAAGVVRTPFGPAPSVAWSPDDCRWRVASTRLAVPHVASAQWLVRAYIPLPSVESSAAPLLAAMHAAGRIRPYRPVAGGRSWGIEVDRDQHPLDRDGRPDRQLFVLGTICEGRTYYNNPVPFPGSFCRPVHDAHRCVEAALAACVADTCGVSVGPSVGA